MKTDSELDLAKFRSLLTERKELLESITKSGREAAETVELDQSKVGRLSRMDALQAQAMLQETGRRRELELTQIGSALTRLDSGDYGYCLRCDKLILEKRLEIQPAATLCIQCAERG